MHNNIWHGPGFPDVSLSVYIVDYMPKPIFMQNWLKANCYHETNCAAIDIVHSVHNYTLNWLTSLWRDLSLLVLHQCAVQKVTWISSLLQTYTTFQHYDEQANKLDVVVYKCERCIPKICGRRFIEFVQWPIMEDAVAPSTPCSWISGKCNMGVTYAQSPSEQ